ncbi:LOW QUALITY PROTEIN: hypothetical protein ColTof4_11249 [Colletotrichum tofieldiae]|nr:LOW QUALITY PROTEIN: hypothetical protein ColTof3_04434 [Colletotrichum tofieldiae]GKT78826.1 LOW QUALITY PROTEIN: hypothetical protein ColTof4_11249 [Colletotrichum tofieldiae]
MSTVWRLGLEAASVKKHKMNLGPVGGGGDCTSYASRQQHMKLNGPSTAVQTRFAYYELVNAIIEYISTSTESGSRFNDKNVLVDYSMGYMQDVRSESYGRIATYPQPAEYQV